MAMNDGSERDGFGLRWAVAGALVGLVLVAAIGVAIWNGIGSPAEPAVPVPHASVDAPAPGASPAASDKCDSTPASQTIPTEGPLAEWRNMYIALVPYSEEFGPSPREGHLWGCFQKSPTGALFALAHFGAAAVVDDPEKKMYEEAALPNAASAEFLAQREGRAPVTEVASIKGFQFLSVEEEEVVVKLVLGSWDVVYGAEMRAVWNPEIGTWQVDGSNTEKQKVTMQGVVPWGPAE